ncbi:MAG: aminodeoxychorismate/anthranilate synthase component II [Euryarchaeota archaeon]|nr:aminodeoxychorismate/anthranilate synthase component II [Euryarchaeota archaeon]
MSEERPVVDPVTGKPLPDSVRIEPLPGGRRPRILVIDNYDSFTYNLVQYLGELGADPIVHRNDAITLDEAIALKPDGIVISPGPGNPKVERDFGVSGPILTGLSRTVPTLGVCLGLQGFAWLYGGDVAYAPRIMHGKTSVIDHDGKGVFAGVPSPLTVGRYHSLVADPTKVPDALEVSARTTDGEVMGLRHRELPIECVQFHPESILTEHGKEIMRNFLLRTLQEVPA